MLRKIAFVLTLALFANGPSQSAEGQVPVRLPEISGQVGQTRTVPVEVGDLSGEGVVSFDFTVRYDSSVVEVTDVLTEGTLSEGITVEANTGKEGEVSVAAGGTTPLSGGGTLLKLKLRLEGRGTTPLRWSSLGFNEGTPSAAPDNGIVSVGPEQISVRLPEVTRQVGQTTTLPVRVGDLTGQGILSFDFTVRHDGIVEIKEVVTEGTLSEDFSVEANTSAFEEISVSAGGATPLSGSGALIRLKVRTEETGITALRWADFRFNEGTPSVSIESGTIQVGEGGDTGLVTGRVTDAETGGPIPGATVRIQNLSGRKATTNAQGRYQISAPPGTGYTVVATAEEYFAAEKSFVDVRAGGSATVNLRLRPAAQADPTLTTLTPNPNPTVSTVGTGGELLRYYKVTDGLEGPPLPDRRVTVTGGSGGPRTYRTDASGIVAVRIPVSAIGGTGSSATFRLESISGTELPEGRQRTFTAEVQPRPFRKNWALRTFGRASLGVSAGVEASVDGRRTNTGRTSLLERQGGGEASSLQIHRRRRGEAGISVGIGTPKIQAGPAEVGAGASVGSGFFFFRGDAYQFSRGDDPGTKEAAARFYLWARSNLPALGSDNLIRLMTYVADNFVFDETLAETYRLDQYGFGNRTHASASFQAGVESFQNLGLGVGGGIGGEFEAFLSTENRRSGIQEIKGQLEAGARAEAGVAFLPLLQTSPSGGSQEGGALRKSVGTLTGFDRLSLETSLRGRYALGTGCRQGDTQYLFLEAGGRAEGPLGRLAGLSYPDDAEAVSRSTRYRFDVSPALEPAWSGPDGNQTAATLADACSEGGALSIGRSTFSGLMETLGGQAAAASLGEGASNPVRYAVDSTLTRSESGFELSVGGSLGIQASIGGGVTFAQRNAATVEEGVWAQGRHFPTKRYDTLPGVSTTYKEVVGGLLRDVRPDWWESALDFFDKIANPFSGESGVAGKAADSAFDYQIGENGTTVTFDGGAIPPEVDSIQGVSWGWWGAETSTMARDLDPESRAMKAEVRAAAEEEEGMRYGIGGFYRLRPLGTPMQDTTTIEIHYSEEELGGVDESELAVYWKDADAGQWRFVGGEVDADANTVTAPIDSFKTFTLAPRLPTGSFGLEPDTSSIGADGSSTVSVRSTQLAHNDGTTVEDGALYTVETNRGRVATPDADTTLSGTQVEASGGRISFEVRAGQIPGTATLEARSVRGQSSGEGTLTLENTGPPSPVSVTSVEGEDQSVSLSWEEAPEPDVAGYKVHFGPDSSQLEGVAAEGRVSPIDVGDVTETRVPGIANDTTTYVAVSVYDAAGAESSLSAAQSAVPQDTVPPGPPTGVRLAPAEDTLATLSWTAPGDNGQTGRAFAYRVRYGKGPVQDTSQWWAGATPVSVLQSPSSPGTEDRTSVPAPQSDRFRYAVRAVDEAENLSEIRFPRHWAFVDRNRGLSFPGVGVRLGFSGVDRGDMVSVRKFQGRPVTTDSIPERNVSDYRFVIEGGDSLRFDSSEVRLAVRTLNGIDNPENVTVYKRPQVGRGSFTALPTEVQDNGTPEDISDDTLSVTAGSFSEFVLASDTEPLPVELSQFEARLDGEEVVRLSWTTASETGNAGFRVQRKKGRPNSSGNWQAVGEVEGQGTTTRPTSYQFADEDLPYEADALSYRLQQVDRDGSTSFSKEVVVQRGVSEAELLGTYPNPASQKATLRYAVPDRQDVTIHLYDVLGRKVQTVVSGEKEGRQETQLDVSRLSSGVYFLRLRAEGTRKTQRMTVVR